MTSQSPRPSKPPVALAPHANRAAARRIIAIGGMFAAGGIGAGLMLPGSLLTGAFTLGFGGLLVALGLYGRREGDSAQLINRANNLLSEGKLAEAEQLVAYGEHSVRGRRMRRALEVLQASVAMRLGDFPRALTKLDHAIAAPRALLGGELDRVQLSAAWAMRAVLRASAGDRDGAAADIELVRRSELAFPECLARAALADAILLERAGERDKLRDLLVRERALLLGHTRPRERAIVRAYQRMLRATATTVYRTGASRDPGPTHGEPTLADWVAKIAPGAASFVRATPSLPAAAPVVPAPVDPAADAAARKAAAARLKKGGGAKVTRTLALWVVLVGLFLAMWQFLAPDPGMELAEPELTESPALSLGSVGFALVVLAFLFVLIWVKFKSTRSRARKFIASLNAVARDDESGEAQLTAAARDKNPVISAAAWLQMAALAERRGRLADALDACDSGLRALSSETLRVQTSDLLYPELLAQRAFVLLALGRRDEGVAEIALVGEGYPSFPFLARARFRFMLLDHVQRGDLAGALSVAREGEELALSIRDELLADLVRAVASPETLGAEEAQRLRDELRLDAEARAWIGVVANEVLERFQRGPEADATEAQAEAEAAAEAEAEGALALATRRA